MWRDPQLVPQISPSRIERVQFPVVNPQKSLGMGKGDFGASHMCLCPAYLTLSCLLVCFTLSGFLPPAHHPQSHPGPSWPLYTFADSAVWQWSLGWKITLGLSKSPLALNVALKPLRSPEVAFFLPLTFIWLSWAIPMKKSRIKK